MKNKTMLKQKIFTVLVLSFSLNLHAQKNTTVKKSNTAGSNKIFCWQENGQTKCGNIPESNERVEINSKTGIEKRSNPIKIKKTESVTEERASLQKPDPVVQSFLLDYPTEADLLKSFNEQIENIQREETIIVQEIKTTKTKLINLLKEAADIEMSGEQIEKMLATSILKRKSEALLLEAQLKRLQEQKETLKNKQTNWLEAYRIEQNRQLQSI